MQAPSPAMVRLTMERVRIKLDAGVALTTNEENFLAECRRIYHMKPREEYKFDSEGNMYIVRSSETSPVINAVKSYGEILDKNKSGVAGARLFGMLDPITCAVFLKESGLKLGSQEFAQFVKKKLNSGEYSAFKVQYT